MNQIKQVTREVLYNLRYLRLLLVSLVTLNALKAGFGIFSPQRDVMECIVAERRILANRCKILPTFSIIFRFVIPNNIKYNG